jgi:hypothetical protein
MTSKSESTEITFVLPTGAGVLLFTPGADAACEIRSYSPAPGDSVFDSGNVPPHLETMALIVWITSNENLLKPLLDEFRYAVRTVSLDNPIMARIKMLLGVPLELAVNPEKAN